MQETTVLKSTQPGPALVILVGVHGNELCGLDAARLLIPTLKLLKGSVRFVVGNPLAVDQKVRFTEMNLNRAFRPDNLLSEEERSTYEYRRSRELMPFLDVADAMLDVHSSASKQSVPFIICEPHSYHIAQQLPASIISSGWDFLEAGGTDYYMNSLGKVGITFESGYHVDPQSVDRAIQAITQFLISYGLIDGSNENQLKSIITAKEIYHTVSMNFRPVKDFADFEPVIAGQLLAYDSEIPVHAKYDGVIIFARNRDTVGSEGFLLGITNK